MNADSPMQCRLAKPDDVVSLAELFANSVRMTGPAAYSSAQVESWAASANDLAWFRNFILQPTTYLVIDETGPVGFCGIEECGHITSVYVRGDRQRSGIGTRLMEVLIQHAARAGIQRLSAEASEFSLPLFLKSGFRCSGTESIDRNGSVFVRHLVERTMFLSATHKT